MKSVCGGEKEIISKKSDYSLSLIFIVSIISVMLFPLLFYSHQFTKKFE